MNEKNPKISIEDFISKLVIDDLYLATACSLGDNIAWQEFDKKYKNFIYNFAMNFFHNKNEAENLIKIIYSELYIYDYNKTSKISSYIGRGSLKSWLKIVINRIFCQEYAERKKIINLSELHENYYFNSFFNKNKRQSLTQEDDYFLKNYGNIFQEVLPGIICKLAPKEKNILFNYYFDKMNLNQIASTYNVNTSTISRWLKRIINNIRKDIEQITAKNYRINTKEVLAYLDLVYANIDFDIKSKLLE